MRFLREIIHQITALFRTRNIAGEIDAEVAQHLEFATADFIEGGMSPKEARLAALRKFGNVEAHKDRTRDSWGNRGILDTVRDFQFGMRLCARYPSSSIMAVMVLAMGVALATIMYTMASEILDQGAGAELDERLLFVEWEIGQPYGKQMNTHDFKHFRTEVDSLENFVGIQYSNFWVNLPAREADGKQFQGLLTSPRFFDLTRAKPARGSLFTKTPPIGEREVIISDSAWLDFFNRSDVAIGELLVVGGMNCKVIGVMPVGFAFPGNRDIWISTDWQEYDGLPRAETPTIGLVGRLKDNVSIEQVRVELETISAALEIQYPDTNEDLTRVRITPFREMFINEEALTIAGLILVGSFPVLLFACVNVFNIIMARTAKRTHELAIRSSMGAKRSHIIWQVIVDGLTLAMFGAVFGIGLALVGLHFVSLTLESFDVSFLHELKLSPLVVVFSIGTALISGLVSSFIPAWRASKIDSFAIMKDESSTSTSIYIGWLSKLAVISQVAFSGVLLFLSILFLIPSLFIDAVEMPYNEDSVLTTGMALWTDPQIKTPADIEQFYATLKETLRARTGVDAVALSSAEYGLMGQQVDFEFEGEDRDSQLYSDHSRVNSVTADYLNVYGVAPLSGRMLNIFDTADSVAVCVVNTNFINAHCKHLDPMGMRLNLAPEAEIAEWVTIVGVIPSLKPDELGWGEDVNQAFSEILVPMAQRGNWNPTLLVSATNAGRPELRQALRESVQETAPLVQLNASFTVKERIDLLGKIFEILSLGAKLFGGGILAMSLVGLYAIVSFATAQRRKEFGIRLAIGSTGLGIAKSVLKPWAVTIGSGLVLSGIATAILIVFYMFMDVSGNPESSEWRRFITPAVITAAIICMASSIAMAMPAWRATRVDPMAVMRIE